MSVRGLHRLVQRLVRFGAVGASGALVNLLLLFLLVDGAGLHYALAALIGIEISTLSNFALNRAWTWRDREAPWRAVGHYHVVVLAGVLTQYVVMVGLVEATGIHYLLASLGGVAAGMALNFIGNDRLTFGGTGARGSRVVAYAAGALGMLAVGVVWHHPWDGFVFLRSVEDWVLHGVTPYHTGGDPPLYAYHGWSLPAAAHWYAYPPLPLLAMAATAGPGVLAGAPDAVLRILVKVPAMAGWLATGAIVHALVARRKGAEAAARAERWVVLNPAGWAIAGIWGQFEPLLIAFALLAALWMLQARWKRAGAAFGLALLVKPFALFLAPVWGIYAYRRGGARGLLLAGAMAGAVWMLVSLPFILAEPTGFWHQVFGMHAERGPARYAPMAAIHAALRAAAIAFGGTAYDVSATLSVLSFLLTAVVLTAVAVAAWRRPVDDAHPFLWGAMAFTGALLCTKVINEQYLLVPLVLWLVAWQLGAARHARAMTWSLSLGLPAAALVDGGQFMTFMQPAIAEAVLGGPGMEALAAVAAALGLGTTAAVHLGRGLAIAALAPAALIALHALAGPILEAMPKARRMRARPVLAAALVLLLIVPSGVGSSDPALAEDDARDDAQGGAPDGRLLALVRTTWTNPGNDPERPHGSWAPGMARPEDGYYTVNAAKAERDLDRLLAMGVDGVILVVDPVHERNGKAWRMVLHERGVPYTFAIDAGLQDEEIARALVEEGPYVPWWHRESFPPATAGPALRPHLDVRYVLGDDAPGLRPLRAGTHGGLTVLTSEGGVLAPLTDAAAASGVVVVPWNDFGGLGALEPMQGRGDDVLGVAIREASRPDRSGSSPGGSTSGSPTGEPLLDAFLS